jgi:hypothetical protein
MVQDESVGFVQGTSFRSGNHCALPALVSRIQIELSGLGPNDGGTRNCADAPNAIEAVKKCIYDAFFFWLSMIEFREKELSME